MTASFQSEFRVVYTFPLFKHSLLAALGTAQWFEVLTVKVPALYENRAEWSSQSRPLHINIHQTKQS